jgi:MFS family permease
VIEKRKSSEEQDIVDEKATWRNLPHKKQLLLLSLCRLSAPLSNACLIPYLYFLVKSIISNPERPNTPQHISRITGLLVAAFPVGQMITSMLWGRLSDEYGRRPAILLGLAVSVIANVAFGFSRSIGMLMFWRIVAGMANGTLGVMRTMTAEIVKDRKHQPRAFLAPPVIFNSGRVIALVIGGCLADPVRHIPSLFGSYGLFNVSRNADGVIWALKYPYALPALFNGVVLGICLFVAALGLRESLPARKHNQDFVLMFGDQLLKLIGRKAQTGGEYTLIRDEEADTVSQELSTPTTSAKSTKTNNHRLPVRKIWTRHLLKTLFAFALLPLHNATFLHIFPILLSMPAPSAQHPRVLHFFGGLGLASPTIGLFLATFGIAGILLQLFIYPRIHLRIGTLGTFRLANAHFPIVYMVTPYLVLTTDHEYAKWAAMAAVLFTQVMARTMAIPSSVILLTEAAPHRSVLGTVHGAGNMLSAFASACGPLIGGVLLAKGIEIEAVGLVWWTWLCTVSLAALLWSFVLKDYQRDARSLVMNRESAS